MKTGSLLSMFMFKVSLSMFVKFLVGVLFLHPDLVKRLHEKKNVVKCKTKFHWVNVVG